MSFNIDKLKENTVYKQERINLVRLIYFERRSQIV